MTPPHGTPLAVRPGALPPDPHDRPPPRRAGDIELLGPMAGSGYRRPPCLVRRADGQTLQLTPALYAVLEAVDGRRDAAALAAEVAERHGLGIDPDDISFLLEAKLQPLGVLKDADGSDPTVSRSNPLLALRGRKVMAPADTTVRWADRVTFLFNPLVVVGVLTAFFVTSGWLFVGQGLAGATRQVIYQPGLLLAVFGVTLVSAGFHELGHAAACRYGGATPGVMGAALYLVWPAFYTDVTDSYRLDRRGRLRVDLGGIYFNAVFSVGAFALWVATRQDALFVVMFLQLVQILRQLVPIVRFDGYYVLADLTGVPDLFGRIKPVVRGALPWRWGSPEAKVLKPWARVVVTAWVALVVPILLVSLLLMIVALPGLVATAWDSLGVQWTVLGMRWADSDFTRLFLTLISIAAIAVPVLSVSYLLFRIGRRTARRVWRASEDDGALRVATVLVALALAVAATAAWWPAGQYHPIGASGRITVSDGVGEVAGLVADAMPVAFATGPAAAGPAPSVPVGAAGAGNASEAVPPPSQRATFVPPAPPGEGDNQALAVNYLDGTSVFDVALSLLWAHGDDVQPANQAYALASCRQCLTMAVAFQLILVIGDADVVGPRNEAVAANALCDTCITRALAMQVLLSLPATPDEAVLGQLALIWDRLGALSQQLETMTFEQTYRALTDIEVELIQLFSSAGGAAAEQAVTADAGPSPASTSTGSAAPSTTSTSEAGEGTTTSTEGPTSSSSTSSSSTTSTTEPSSTTTSTTAPSSSTTSTQPPTTTTAPVG